MKQARHGSSPRPYRGCENRKPNASPGGTRDMKRGSPAPPLAWTLFPCPLHTPAHGTRSSNSAATSPAHKPRIFPPPPSVQPHSPRITAPVPPHLPHAHPIHGVRDCLHSLFPEVQSAPFPHPLQSGSTGSVAAPLFPHSLIVIHNCAHARPRAALDVAIGLINRVNKLEPRFCLSEHRQTIPHTPGVRHDSCSTLSYVTRQ